ncbi:hypothetical protein E8E14_009486 [Neopestalotiopsis sp. 37M]|nr:hypothetical protein E8E14_009486 [Neopestalotiopsis sp. 37M]
MGRESRKQALPAIGKSAKARHSKAERMAQADPSIYSTLNALKHAPAPKLTHKSYFEIAENTDKKKKLEIEVTANETPPPGYAFVALGNPDLTKMCKELSREQDAMMFIVSESTDQSVHTQTHRLGYHFRERIVDQARESLLASGKMVSPKITSAQPESTPKDRNQIFKEADAVLRDLFPRIPNSNRMDILRHSFDKDNKFFNGREKVGMAGDLPLSRRVQLAALSHIRHTMTRYDDLLKEGQRWENARKAVEQPCLDIIVKWRGDEETGRDQLDEILREVIEISDDEDSDEDSTEEEQVSVARKIGLPSDPVPNMAEAHALVQQHPPARSRASSARSPRQQPLVVSLVSPAPARKLTRKERKAARQTQQRFKRYEQVAETFGRNPAPPGPPRNEYSGAGLPEMTAVSASRTYDYVREPERTMPQSAAPPPPGSYTHQDVPPIASRSRGQSPIFVRIADGNMPKVGHAVSRPNYSPHAMSPVRTQFQDLLVRSIEPQSPGVSQSRDNATSYPFRPEMGRIAEAPQVIARPVIPRQDGPATSTVVLGPEEMPASRRQVSTRFPEQSELFSGTGFIQVHREPGRRIPIHGRPDDLRNGQSIPVTRPYERRSRSPIAHPPAGAYRETGRVFYRSRPGTIYAHEPAYNGRDEIPLSSRDRPIVLDGPGPRIASRSADAHRSLQDMEYDPRQPGEVDFLRRVPTREPNGHFDRSEVIYANDHNSRQPYILQQSAERPHSNLVPVGSRTGRAPEPLPFGADVFQSSQTTRPPLESTGRHVIRGSDFDAYVPAERVLPQQPRPTPNYPIEPAYDYERRHERIIVRDPGRDQGFIQQARPGPEYGYRSVSNHY